MLFKNTDVYNYNDTRLEEDNEGREKKIRSCAGNVVQVFGFKNNFPGEAGYNGFPENFLCPHHPKGCENPQSKILKATVMRCRK